MTVASSKGTVPPSAVTVSVLMTVAAAVPDMVAAAV